MKTKIKRFNGICIFVVFAFLALYSSTAFSAVPEAINYQGTLSDNGGNPINATLNITFTLYDVDAGPGTILWQEVQSVTVTNGQFSVELGADGGNPLPAPLDDPIFLGVQVDADAEMTPRQKFASTAFALRAKTVESDTLSSLSCSGGQIPKWNGSAWLCDTDNNNAGDITGITAGTGIIGGGTSGNVNIAVNTNVIQSRVINSCTNGSSIRHINVDGTVSCEVDTDTTYTAGNGLSQSGTFFSMATAGVTSVKIATGAVTTSKIPADAIVNGHIADNAVDQSKIAADSITESKIVDGAVSVSKLTDLAKGVGVNGSIVIPATAFRPDNETRDVNYTNGFIHAGNTNTGLCLTAPVILPHGVMVTHFELSIWDNSATTDVGSFELRRVIFDTGALPVMASVTSSGSSPSVQVLEDTSLSSATIDSFGSSYEIFGCFVSDAISATSVRLYGARIRYN